MVLCNKITQRIGESSCKDNTNIEMQGVGELNVDEEEEKSKGVESRNNKQVYQTF